MAFGVLAFDLEMCVVWTRIRSNISLRDYQE